MFLITKNKEADKHLLFYQKQLASIIDKKKVVSIQISEAGDYLFWTGIKPADNLHVFTDGYVIGKLDFNEPNKEEPTYHHKKIPERKSTLIQNVIVRTENGSIEIYPNEQTNTFYSQDSVSDYQLLIAKNDKLIPDYMRVSVMASCAGYFPGDLTLFKEVKKISYLHSLDFYKQTEVQEQQFQLQKSSDKKLVQRFQEIVPKDVKSGMSLSGGMDSRFVLGVLLSQGVKPTVYSRSHIEDDIVEGIAKHLGLDAHIVKADFLDPFLYTIASDARIYYRGGNYSQLRGYIKPDEILYNGLWSGASIENSWKVAWKKPGLMKNIFGDIITHGILNAASSKMDGMQHTINKEEIKQFLMQELAYQNEYYDFPRRKVWAGWYYHINKGISRLPAALSDTSYFTYPVFLLGDRKAVELGVGSPAYANFYKERLRRINRKLYDKKDYIDYAGGRSFKSLPPVVLDFYKIYFEYAYKFFRRYKRIKEYKEGIAQETVINDISFDESRSFSNYFKNDLKTNVENAEMNFSLRRVMITVNHVLKFLND
jgi:hypothetical protein